MAGSLGILVSSDRHLDHLIGLTKAAHEAGHDVRVFLTHRGLFLTQDERFLALEGLCHISLCNICLELFEIPKPVPLVKEQDYGTQMRNVLLMRECDRYVVL